MPSPPALPPAVAADSIRVVVDSAVVMEEDLAGAMAAPVADMDSAVPRRCGEVLRFNNLRMFTHQ